MTLNLLFLLLTAVLVLCNAFFVAAEFGMVKLRPTRVATLKRTYGIRGKILSQVHKHLDAYLSACQLGITLASLGLGWIGEPTFANLLEPAFETLGIQSQELIVYISFIAAFSIISFLHIVVGELVPKSLAIRQSEQVSLWTAIPLFIFYWVMYPAIWVLNSCANFILKIARLDKSHKGETTYSPEEIKLILSTTHTHTALSKQEMDILKHSIELYDLEAVDVMRPIDDMIALKSNQTINAALPTVLQHRYSRYPVYNEETNDILGLIHVKDVLFSLSQQHGDQELLSILRPILKVPSTLSAINLLNKLQEGIPHFAVVYSNRNTAIGFVTIDNIFQILVGRIRDEFHNIAESWTVAPDGSFIMNGNSALYVLERALDIDIELDPETEKTSDTIFGLILTTLQRLPHEGEKIEFDKFTIIVKKMKGHKIAEVAVYPKLAANN